MKMAIDYKRNKRILGLELLILLTISLVGSSSSSIDDLAMVSSNYTNITVDLLHQSPYPSATAVSLVYNRIGNTYSIWEERKYELMKAKGVKEEHDEERKAHLEQVHAEYQSLLKGVSFKALPLLQKPNPSIWERTRKRKLEVSKKFSQSYNQVKVDNASLDQPKKVKTDVGELSDSVEKENVSSVSNGDSKSNETDVLGERKSYDNGSSQTVKKRSEGRVEEKTHSMKANETKGLIRVKGLLFGEILKTADYGNYVTIFTCFFVFLTWAASPPKEVFVKHGLVAFLLWFLNFAVGYCVKQQEDEKAIMGGWQTVQETIFYLTFFGAPLIMAHSLFITLWSWEGLRGKVWSTIEAIRGGIFIVAQAIRWRIVSPFSSPFSI